VEAVDDLLPAPVCGACRDARAYAPPCWERCGQCWECDEAAQGPPPLCDRCVRAARQCVQRGFRQIASHGVVQLWCAGFTAAVWRSSTKAVSPLRTTFVPHNLPGAAEARRAVWHFD
jgi:hypothetical protein